MKLRSAIIRVIALATLVCGLVIIHNGIFFLVRTSRPYKENLDALSSTIKELDKTIVGLRDDVRGFDNYLAALGNSLNRTESDIGDMDNAASAFIDLAGNSTVAILGKSSSALNEGAKALRTSADQAGSIPKDPLASQRANLYSIAGSCEGVASTMEKSASDIEKQAKQFGKITASGLGTARASLKTTSEQIEMLKDGSLKHVPVVMESMSSQLNSHLRLIEESYALLLQVTIPVLAIGFGFVCIGLRSLLFPGS